MKRRKDKKFCSCVGLTKEQISFLDNLSKCCRYSGGKKLSKAAIVRSLISALRELNIDVDEIRSEKQLTDRVVQSFCKYK